MTVFDAKSEVREQCSEWAGEGYRVIDLVYAPEHRSMYRGAGDYIGVSQNPDHAAPDVRIGNPLHLIPGLIGSASACTSVIDIDTKSNPYLILAQVGRYAPEGIYSIALTDGNRRSMVLPQGSEYVRWITKFPGENCRFLHRWYDDFARWSLAEIPRMEVVCAKRTTLEERANSVYYYALRVKFTGPVTGALK